MRSVRHSVRNEWSGPVRPGRYAKSEVVAPFSSTDKMLKDLKAKVLKEREGKCEVRRPVCRLRAEMAIGSLRRLCCDLSYSGLALAFD